jgi:hypothetical protein
MRKHANNFGERNIEKAFVEKKTPQKKNLPHGRENEIYHKKDTNYQNAFSQTH